jgi:hypothetical protein
MKNLTVGLIAATTVFLLSAMAALAADASISISPGPIGPGNTAPNTYMANRSILIGITVDSSGSSINTFYIRNHNYAFTGEQIYYYVLVRDANGVADINQVVWTKDSGSEMGPCDVVAVAGNGNNARFTADDGNVNYINQATNLAWSSDTDKIYKCILTVESSWSGASSISVSAKDQGGSTGATVAESWTFNPPLSVSLTTSDGQSVVSFGSVNRSQSSPEASSPNCLITPGDGGLVSRNCTKDIGFVANPSKLCDISFSDNKLVLTNTGTLVDLWPFIAATDFSDSTGMAKCPFSNSLSANQFEYRSIQGSWDSGWRVMPEYSTNLGCYGQTLATNNTCRGGCRITVGSPIDVLSPGQSIETSLKIVWPTPCIGTFDTGSIYAIVRAV